MQLVVTFPVRFCTFFDKTNAVFSELFARLDVFLDLIHFVQLIGGIVLKATNNKNE